MRAVIVHLSDIHFDDSGSNPVRQKVEKIAAAVYAHLPGCEHCFLVVSGDIAQSGRAEQYALASSFLADLEVLLRREAGCEISVVIAPGNHDCNFERDSNARKGSKRLIESDGLSAVDDSTIAICTSVQEEYFEFLKSWESQNWVGDRLFRQAQYDVASRKISFETLNISWLSDIREGQGNLFFPHEKYSETSRLADVNIIVMHHPLNWFNHLHYRSFRTFLRSRATILLTGHEHQVGVSEIEEIHSGKSVALEGSVLQSANGLADSGFGVVVVDFEIEQYQVINFRLEGDGYVSQGMGAWSDYRPLPEKRESAFSITSEFSRLLNDPGAYLANRSGNQLRLSDIYVYPDLQPLDETEEKRRFISSTTMLSVEALGDGVLIQGDENTGKTSLLYQLLREYLDRGLVPLYLAGERIRRPTADEVDGVIRRAVTFEYGAEAVSRFQQTEKSKKVLLIDDLDDSPVRTDIGRAQVLERLRERFGVVVMTVGPLFEMNEIVSDGKLDASICAFNRFQLQAFGNVKRSELVKRWFEIHSDHTIDESEILGKRDAAEKLINGVMNKSLISHTPLYMLTLLQSIEDGRSGELKDSALGYYYQFLLTSALQREGVRAEKLRLYFQYCAHLAWEFHVAGKQALSTTELREFNQRYSAAWSTVDFVSTLDVLLRAHVLVRVDEFYSFRYPYIYYFLKGFYINEYIDIDGMREYVASCCEHLYVRDNANTVLFLAHHSSGDFVVSQIAQRLNHIFQDQPVARLEEDTLGVTGLISQAPELSYDGGSPEDHRRHRDEIDDDQEREQGLRDGLLDKKEQGAELSLAAKLATLMKTSEILGQVLKDQYAKIPRARKAQLIGEIADGSLRAMSDFFGFMTRDSEKLVMGLRAKMADEGRFERSDENEAAARMWVANLIQAVTVGLIMRAAQNVGSVDLREDVAGVVRDDETMAYRMIEIATYMDSARPIPRGLLESAYWDSDGNVVVRQLLTILVLHRLYMFKTSEADMKWLASKMKLRMDLQKSLAHYRDEMKKLL